MSNQMYPVIVIAGTNASGKSSLGIDLATKYNGEIISADSRQIFSGFDLCCGKVNSDEQKIVPHHMIDICNIGDTFSVADYQREVYVLVPQIIKRGKLPFIVGGTGLYIDAVVNGYDFPNETLDQEYRTVLNTKSISELQQMLSDYAKTFIQNNYSDYNNKRRLIRLIEKEKNGSSLSVNNNPLYDTLQIGVTWPRNFLDERIDARLKARILQGMIEEVREYLESGGKPEYLYNLGLEYKYIAWFIEGKYPTADAFFQELSTAIKRFSKQQLKWFKRNKAMHWVNMEGDYFSESCSLIDAFLSKRNQAN